MKSASTFAAIVVLGSSVSAVLQGGDDPIFDHQKKTYYASHEPALVSNASLTMETFFSPDNSINMYVDLIESAPEHSQLDIYSPSFASWTGCTWDDDQATCIGCSVGQTKAETFPVFPAVLNAVHQRNVSVRLITNDFDTPTCPGEITPVDFWVLNGVQVHGFQSTTFMHSKVVIVTPSEGAASSAARLAISSVNWSHASLMENREAGVLVHGSKDAAALFAMVQGVFDADWAAGSRYVVNNQYSPAELRVIQNTTAMPVVVPQADIPGHYVAPASTPLSSEGTDMHIYTSPDFARNQLLEDVKGATESFQLFMYQVTDQGLCDALIDMIQAGKNLTMLVSHHIYDQDDYEAAKQCYTTINEATGFSPQLTETDFKYSHQKYWIVDGRVLGLSTGNWSPSDYPVAGAAKNAYPPHGKKGWQRVNRDFTVHVAGADELLSVYNAVFNADYARGSRWTPDNQPVFVFDE